MSGENLNISNKKVFSLIITVVMIYMLFGLVWFFCGPIKWGVDFETVSLVFFVLLVSSYFGAFLLGYQTRRRKVQDAPLQVRDNTRLHKFLNITIYLNLVMTTLNALQYSYTQSIGELINNAIMGLINPKDAYFSKINTMLNVSTSSSVLTYITVFMAPILYPTLIMSVYYFKELALHKKIIVCVTLLFEVFRWLAIGTNKGLLDIAVLFLTVMFVRSMRSRIIGRADMRQRKKSRRFLFLAILAFVVFLICFGYFLVSRASDYPEYMFQEMPYSLVPEFFRSPVYKFSSYLCQGYASFYLMVTKFEWIPTWGVGNSVFLAGVVERITGWDVMSLTYQERIVEAGYISSAAWHTGFSFFANDVSIFGVGVVMLVAGTFFASLIKESILEENPVSMALLYMMILGILNISCTNYILAYSNMCVGFIGLCLWRKFTRNKVIHISFGRWKI